MPFQFHYGGLDERINAGWLAYEATLKQHNKTCEAYCYEGVNHGFHNDSTPHDCRCRNSPIPEAPGVVAA